MKLLSEEEEDAYLDEGQQAEEGDIDVFFEEEEGALPPVGIALPDACGDWNTP